MSSVDERVVKATFDNSQFEQGAKTTLSTLGKLKQGLDMKGASKGLEDVGSAANKLNLTSLSNAVQGISSKFSAMGIAGVTALTNIVNKAVDAGQRLAKSFTVDPIKQGLQEYETNLNSVQTILANTQASGAKLGDVNRALKDLNQYSDQTIYNFSEMARNIGTFTAAGVDLDTSAASIKGIANLAALSGSNSQQASTAMYQLSQAIASGRVSLMDWNSVVNAGMGGTTFQRALAETAVSMGTLDKGALKLSGKMKNVTIDGKAFRDSISAEGGKESWLTSKVLTTTLKQFTGDLTDAQLKAQGFNDAQIKAIQATAKTAKSAATEVKTFTGLIDTTKEAVGSGWAQTWELIFGDFEEAKKLWTGASGAIGELVSSSANARNKLIGDWKELGGRTAMIDAVKNAFAALNSIVAPIKKAFRDIFPATTGKTLYEITIAIRDFFAGLKMGEETAFKVRRIFQGLFAVLDIGWSIIKAGVGILVELVQTLFQGSGGMLDFAAKVGDWLTSMRYAVKSGDGFVTVIQTIEKVLKAPIVLIRELAKLIVGLFNSDTGGEAVSGSLDRMASRFSPVTKLADMAKAAWDGFLDKMRGVLDFIKPFTDVIVAGYDRLFDSLTNSFKTGDFSGVLDAINTGLLGGIVLLFKKFVNNGLSVDLGGGFLDKMGGIFEGLTDTMGAMQTKLKADALMKIAGAIGILAASVLVISLIDSAALSKALGAITVMFLQLAGVLAVLEKFGMGSAKLPVVASGLILLSVAVLILSASVKNLSGMSWEELAKGLLSITVLLGGLIAVTNLMPANQKKMISTGIGLMAIGLAIKILASAVNDFAAMDWSTMAKGLVGVGAVLLALGIFTRLSDVNKMGLSNGAGLVLLAISLKLIASAVQDFADMDWAVLGKGFASMGVALLMMAGAMRLLPKSIIAQAAGLVLVAGALIIVAQALSMMGGMSWEEIGKGLATLAGGLLIIAVAMKLMTTALPGALALVIVAGALAILTPVLIALGGMTWEEIAKGLTAIAGAFVILGVAGLVLGPLVPILLGLGAAVILLGVGTLAAGVGLIAMSAGLAALSVAGVGAGAAITAIGASIIGLIPAALKAVAEGIVQMAKILGDSAPQFVDAAVKLMTSLLKGIEDMAPKIVATLLRLIMLLLNAVSNSLPEFIRKGVDIIVALLDGLAQNLPRVITAATNLIVALVRGIGDNLFRIIEAGAETILKFMNSIADSIRKNSAAFNKAGSNILSAIIDGLVNGVGAFAGTLWNAAQRIGQSFMDGIKNFFGIHSPSKAMYEIGQFVMQGFRNGLDGNADAVTGAFNSLKEKLQKNLTDMKKTITTYESQLKKLTGKRYKTKKDRAEISRISKALAAVRTEYSQTNAAITELTKNWTDDKNKLVSLAKNYDELTAKMADANKALEDATKTRDDYAKSVQDQYDNLPSLDANSTTESFATDMREQIKKTQEFAAALQKLRDLGLNDTLYKELLGKGPQAMPFVEDLMRSGSAGVSEINKLSDELAKSAEDFGKNAGKQLYQAAVDSAKGLVDGLKKNMDQIEAQMDLIADAMVNAIKKKLGIKSPSRVFRAIGEFTGQGLISGLEGYRGEIAKTSRSVGQEAIDSMRKTISGMTSALDGTLEMRPVISPVLDLSDVRRESRSISSMLSNSTISASGSAASMKRAESSYLAARAREFAAMPDAVSASELVGSGSVNYIQNNYSPKALSTAEIYRQTNNLISVAKGGVNAL